MAESSQQEEGHGCKGEETAASTEPRPSTERKVRSRRDVRHIIWSIIFLGACALFYHVALSEPSMRSRHAEGSLWSVDVAFSEGMVESYVHCKDLPGYNQTCLLKNVYYSPENGWFTLNVLEGHMLPDTEITGWGGVIPGGSLLVNRFSTRDLLREHIERLAPIRQPGVTLFFEAMFHFNWAHALFDGLYPAFVALAKFGFHRDKFVPFVSGTESSSSEAEVECRDAASQNTHMACAMEEAFRLFASQGDAVGKMLKTKEVMAGGRWVVFDQLIIGSGHMGQAHSVLSLPATSQFPYLAPDEQLLPLFVSRLYRAHGLTPPRRRKRSDRGRSFRGRLKTVITHNKRFTSQFVAMLHATVDHCNSRSSDLSVDFVDWSLVQPFRRQLELLREVDILVSSTGTALFFSLLLPDGSVTVNLGTSANAEHSFPSYGEEFLGASARGSRMLYLPLEQILMGPRETDLAELLEQAAALIRSGFSVRQGRTCPCSGASSSISHSAARPRTAA